MVRKSISFPHSERQLPTAKPVRRTSLRTTPQYTQRRPRSYAADCAERVPRLACGAGPAMSRSSKVVPPSQPCPVVWSLSQSSAALISRRLGAQPVSVTIPGCAIIATATSGPSPNFGPWNFLLRPVFELRQGSSGLLRHRVPHPAVQFPISEWEQSPADRTSRALRQPRDDARQYLKGGPTIFLIVFYAVVVIMTVGVLAWLIRNEK